MKKLIFALFAIAGINSMVIAQAVPAKKVVATKMEVVKTPAAKKADGKVVAISRPATAVVKAPAVTQKSTTAPLKKDGTPDKRFKANTIDANGPLKKDGKPDMRYKVNKKH